MMSVKGFLVFVLVLFVIVEASVEDCSDGGCDGQEEEANNKFALLFRQMLAKQREIAVDCTVTEDCPDSLECISYKCRAMGPRRTKIINLYSRW